MSTPTARIHQGLGLNAAFALTGEKRGQGTRTEVLAEACQGNQGRLTAFGAWRRPAEGLFCLFSMFYLCEL